MTLIWLSIAWVIGIYVGSKFAFPLWTFVAGIIPLLLMPFLYHYKKNLLLSCFCLCAFVGGSIHFQSSLPQLDEHHLQFYNDQGKVEIEGLVVTEPEIRARSSVFQLSTQTITTGTTTEQIAGKVLIYVSRYSEYHYGDMLTLSGNLETPPQFEDFNYRDYLAHQKIYSTMYYPKTTLVTRNKGSQVLAFIYSLRNNLSKSLSNVLHEPQSSLANGILLGLRSNIPQSLTQAFSTTGTIHLLAISGLNLSIIVGMFLSIGMRLFGRRYYLYIWLAFTGIWFYAMITGVQPPVVRSAIMGSMFLIAELLGRQRSAATVLTFAAAVMVGIEPQILWDVSFQLSFLAMMGLVFIFPYLQVLSRQRGPAASNSGGFSVAIYTTIADSFAVTLSAIIAIWPVVAYYFDIVSLIALPANFFAIPSLPAIVITTALASITGLFLPLIAQIVGWLAWLFLSYLMLIVQVFNAIPISFIKVSMQEWQVWGYYAFLTAIAIVLTRKSRLSFMVAPTASQIGHHTALAPGLFSNQAWRWCLVPLLLATILVWTAVLSMPDNKLHVSILNVGQGDAILIQTPDHHKILIDGGPSPQAIKEELGKKLAFWDRKIDLLISTQPQADHASGLIEVLQYYNVTQVMTSGILSNSTTYNQMLKIIQAKEITCGIVHAGQEINFGDIAHIEVLHPPAPPLQGTGDDINNNSLVLRLSYNAVSFLFTSDIEEEAEWGLISKRANLTSTVLKVAHHGSRTSTSRELLTVTDPKVAVISSGTANNFQHPHPEVIARLTQRIGADKVFLTSRNGSAEFITDGKALWVKTER